MVAIDRQELYNVLTLWFAAMIFLQTGTGASNPLVTAIAFLAIGLTYAIPLYLVVALGSEVVPNLGAGGSDT